MGNYVSLKKLKVHFQEIIKIVATRCQILRLKCISFEGKER